MKANATGARSSAAKRRAARGSAAPANPVDDYLARVPEPARTTLSRIRAIIRSVVPAEASEDITYRMPVFRYRGLLIGYAAFPRHCGLYPMSPAVIEAHKDELAAFPTSKGAIRFPVDQPLPASLVRKLVKARIAENENRKRG